MNWGIRWSGKVNHIKRVNRLNLFSIMGRLFHLDLIFNGKILNHHWCQGFFSSSLISKFNRCSIVFVLRTSLNVWKKFFPSRVISSLKNLSGDIINSSFFCMIWKLHGYCFLRKSLNSFLVVFWKVNFHFLKVFIQKKLVAIWTSPPKYLK